MRWYWALLILLAGCTTAWERQQSRLAEHEARSNYAAASADVRWQLANAFFVAPAQERTPAAEAARYLHLSDLAVKSGDPRAAVEALRDALTADPHQASAVRVRLDRLPLSANEIDRLKREFEWNIAALAPGADSLLHEAHDEAECWSYRVREVRVRHRRTVRTADGMERQVTYDARLWVFDMHSGNWNPESAWVNDAGMEVELVNGPQQPRYRAVVAADRHFYADDVVPPCHRAAWEGPYDRNGAVFVADRLPPSRSNVDR